MNDNNVLYFFELLLFIEIYIETHAKNENKLGSIFHESRFIIAQNLVEPFHSSKSTPGQIPPGQLCPANQNP